MTGDLPPLAVTVLALLRVQASTAFAVSESLGDVDIGTVRNVLAALEYAGLARSTRDLSGWGLIFYAVDP